MDCWCFLYLQYELGITELGKEVEGLVYGVYRVEAGEVKVIDVEK
jgi:hypothetical protein